MSTRSRLGIARFKQRLKACLITDTDSTICQRGSSSWAIALQIYLCFRRSADGAQMGRRRTAWGKPNEVMIFCLIRITSSALVDDSASTRYKRSGLPKSTSLTGDGRGKMLADVNRHPDKLAVGLKYERSKLNRRAGMSGYFLPVGRRAT